MRLAFLEYRGQAIAFEYGWQAKGVYSPLKVAYDEAFRRLSPGQLLRALLVERFCGDPSMRQIDFLGPSSRATQDYRTGEYSVARQIVALRPLAAPLLGGYWLLSPLVRALRGGPAVDSGPEILPPVPPDDLAPPLPLPEPAAV